MLARLVLVCLGLVLGVAFTRADDAETKKMVKAKAEEVTAALVKGDHEKFVECIHPDLITTAGGKEKLLVKLKAEMKAMADKGFTLKKVTHDNADAPLVVGKETFMVVPYTLEMTTPKGGRLVAKSLLIGISEDAGKTWKFIDGNPGRDAVKKLFPRLPDDLVFPKKEPPVFVKD